MKGFDPQDKVAYDDYLPTAAEVDPGPRRPARPMSPERDEWYARTDPFSPGYDPAWNDRPRPE